MSIPPRTYEKIRGLDQLGLASQLKKASKEVLDDSENPNMPEGGLCPSTTRENVKKRINWISDEGSEYDQDPESYTLTEADDPTLDNSQIQGELGDNESEPGDDPLLVRENEECRKKVAKIKSLYTKEWNPLSYSIKTPPEFDFQVHGLINWINKTSKGCYYIEREGGTLRVIQTPIYHAEIGESSKSKVIIDYLEESIKKSDTSENFTSDTKIKISKERKHEDTPPLGDLTSSGQSLLTQLRNGIYVTPRSKKDKRKLLNLNSFKVKETEIISTIIQNPGIQMPGLIKKLYPRNSWLLLNSLYDVTNYQVKE